MKATNSQIGNIHSVETFGAFDGPGLRYVLFLQGCAMQCRFCHNRDTWTMKPNKLMSVDEILADYDKYKAFYRNGGITISGGEAIIQLDFITELFKKAKEKGIHTCLDTSAGVYHVKDRHKYEILMEYTDLVLLDLKHIDNEKHKWLVGVPNIQILEFAKYLSDIKKPTVIRHVLIPGITAIDEYLIKLRKFIETLDNIVDVDVLPYHTAGRFKWEELGYDYPLDGVLEPTEDEVKHANIILKEGLFA